jgi:hypothetical protein
MESISSSYALEYQIDLSSYFRLSDTIIDESSQASINIDDDVFLFTLQGSGLEDHEVKVVVSIRAAMKIYKHTERKSAILTIKEIQSPSTIDSKDAGLMTSILSFEPSGVVFSKDSVDGELSSGDFITVTTPTLMTWDANWTLDANEVSDALSVVWKENEGDDEWQTCQYGKDFNGIIDINEKKAESRIVVTYLIKHFCCFSIKSCLGLKTQAYALCAMDTHDRNLETYNIQCSICYEHPKYCRWFFDLITYPINDDCFIAYQDYSYDGDSADMIPADFMFIEYHSSEHDYHLKPIDTKVVVQTILWKYKYIPSSFVNVGSYNVTIKSHDEGIRTRIMVVNKLKAQAPNLLKIFVKSVSILVFIHSTLYSFKCAQLMYS